MSPQYSYELRVLLFGHVDTMAEHLAKRIAAGGDDADSAHDDTCNLAERRIWIFADGSALNNDGIAGTVAFKSYRKGRR